MNFQTIKNNILADRFEPVYFLTGEETFYIDTLCDLIIERALTPAERDFNQHLFYARDTNPQEVVNVARKYPTFSQRQLVIVKEAQLFRNWDAFIPYIQNPVPTTILVICHMHRSIDLRTTLGKLVKKQSVFLKANKVREYEVPEWISHYLETHGKKIDKKSAVLILDHLGNDLAKISNELDKLILNIPDAKKVTPTHIEDYIGISKDFNAFALSGAVAKKDFSGAMKIIHYFEQNPKAGPMVFVLTVLYNYFSKIYQLQCNSGLSDSEAAKLIRVYDTYFKDYKSGLQYYNARKVEDIISLIAFYDAKAKGIGNTGAVSPYELLKELLYKIMH